MPRTLIVPPPLSPIKRRTALGEAGSFFGAALTVRERMRKATEEEKRSLNKRKRCDSRGDLISHVDITKRALRRIYALRRSALACANDPNHVLNPVFCPLDVLPFVAAPWPPTLQGRMLSLLQTSDRTGWKGAALCSTKPRLTRVLLARASSLTPKNKAGAGKGRNKEAPGRHSEQIFDGKRARGGRPGH